MPAVYRSSALSSKAEAVARFIEAAETLSADRGNTGLERVVADAAGRADGASAMAGLLATYGAPPAAGGRQITYDPISAGDAEIDFTMDSLDLAIAHAYQVKGVLDSKADEAVKEERSLVGRIASLVGLSGRVRKHLEDRGFSKGIQTAGFVTTVLAQFVVVVLGGVLVGLILNQLIP